MAKILINIVQSSSKGNCIILYDELNYLILDFGVSNQIWRNALSFFNIDNNQISAILLTHYHIDHVRTIEKANTNNLIFYSSQKTINFIEEKFNKKLNSFILNNHIGKWIKVKNSNWKIKSFWTIHNAEESLCFLIKNKNKQLLYLTDTKFFINRKFKNKTAYIIESPFGIEYDLKNKNKININITKEQNHLKLSETEKLLNLYKTKKTKLFLFSHLNPHILDFSIIKSISKKYSNKNIKVNFIHPKEIIKNSYEI